MRVKIGNRKKMFDYASLSIGKLPVGAFLGGFSLADSERENMIRVCERIWQHLRIRCPKSSPFGLYRFDLVPKFNSSKTRNDCIGELDIAGVYELNGHSPECLAAASVMRAFLPEIPCVNAAAIVVAKIKEIFGNEKIAFVVGHKSSLKHYWYQFLVNDLKEAGLRIDVMSPEKVMAEKPAFIWRWGDISSNGNGQYSNCFNEWLFNQKNSFVFNAILAPHEDVSDKSLLLCSDDLLVSELVGNNRPLNLDTMWWSVDNVLSKMQFVVKPDRGASGRDVYFSEKHFTTEWIELLQAICKNKEEYSLWEAKWLPKITVAGKEFAIDINPAFWVDGDKIDYLYTIVRLDEYQRYEKRRKMNVAKGAGIAGLFI
jgi:hypothetical protein